MDNQFFDTNEQEFDDYEKQEHVFLHVEVGDDVLGREINADGQQVKASKDIPAQRGVKFKSQLDRLEAEKDKKLRDSGILKPMEAAGIVPKRAERHRQK